MTLLAVCRCGKQVPAGQLKGDLCWSCQVDQAVELFYPDVEALLHRYERYRQKPHVNLGPVQRQIARVESRVARCVAGIVPDPRLAEQEFRRTYDRFVKRALHALAA